MAWAARSGRELCTLGQRAQQHQTERQGIERVGAHQVAGPKHGVEFVAADDVTKHEHARQQCQPAAGRDGEGHACAAPRVLPVRPIADEQEREHAGQFQNTTSCTRLPETTTPSIAPMKPSSSE